MKTEYKYISSIPYSLHDMRVKKITINNENIFLEFEDGYVNIEEPYNQVDGNITIMNVDFDFTCVFLQSKNGKYRKYKGEKLELSEFLKKYNNYSFEIVDEMYGYNQVQYSGYLSIKGVKYFLEMEINIYYTGSIVYDTVE